MCAWKPLYRSELKEMIHTLDCIKYETRDQLHVKPNNFLNGHDTDCAEDRWTDNIVDPSTYIGKTKDEIYQNPNLSSSSSSSGGFISGYLTPSQWIRFNIESYSASSSSSSESSPYDPHKAAYVGDLNFEVVDTILKTGNLYICVYSSDSGSDWSVARNVEYCWDISSESQIRPNSKKTYFGYYFRNNYLYMYVATNQHLGWVRMLVSDLVEPSDKENYITNEWCFSELGYAYRNVSILQAITNEDELYVCGNMVPYNETFQGIRQYYNTNICSCHVEDDVEISLYEYQEDADGDYIKVESVPQLLDQENWIQSNTAIQTTLKRGQSFTAGITGNLSMIETMITETLGTMSGWTLTVYDGDGPFGTLLLTQSIDQYILYADIFFTALTIPLQQIIPVISSSII
jgi:hypothetical protein